MTRISISTMAGIMLLLLVSGAAGADVLSRAEAEYNIAVGYYNRGDFLYAIEQVDVYLEQFPDDIHHVDAWYLKAESFYQTKDYESAAAAYRRIIELDPSNQLYDDALYGIAWCLVKQGAYAEADPYWEKLQEISDSYREEALYRRGDGAFGREDYAAAEELYKQYLQTYTHSDRADEVRYWLAVTYQREGDQEAFLRTMQRVAGRTEFADKALYALGRYYAEQGDNDEAREHYRRILSRFPESDGAGRALLALATMAFDSGDAVKGRTYLTRLFEKDGDPLASKAGFYLGQLNEREDTPAAAIATYRAVINRFPDMDEYRAQAIMELGELYMAAGDYEAAREVLRSPVSLPDWRHDKPLLEISRSYMLEENYPEARTRLQELLDNYQQEDSVREARTLMAQLQIEEGKYEEARNLIQLVPAADMVEKEEFLLGKADFSLGRYNEAIELFTPLLDEQSEYAEPSRYWLGATYFAAGRYAEAEDEYHAYQEEYPDGAFAPEVWCSLGELFIRVGRIGAAREAFGQVTETAPYELRDRAAYGLAKAIYDADQFDAALQEFQRYLETYASGRFRPEANFFIGAAYFQKEAYDEVITYCDLILERFPHSRMADDAMLLKAKALYYQKKNDLASGLLNELIVRFPNSSLIASAKFYLAKANFRADRLDDALSLVTELRGMERLAFADRVAYLYGLILYKRGDYREALEALRAASESRYRDVQLVALLKLGQCQRHLHQYTASVRSMQQALDLGASGELAGRIYFLLGKTYYIQEKYTDANAALHYAAELLPEGEQGDAWYWLADVKLRMNDYTGIITAVDNYLALPDVELRTEALYKKADALFNLSRYDDAIEIYNQLVASAPPVNGQPHPLIGFAYNAIAECNSKLGDYERSIQAWGQAAEFGTPALAAQSRFNIAKYLYESGDLHGAKERFNELITLHPEHPQMDSILYFLGDIARTEGDAALVIHYLQELLTRFPDSSRRAKARYQLAETALQQGEYELARDNFTQILADGGGDNKIAVHLGLGVAHYYLGELAAARQNLQRVREAGTEGLVEQALYYLALSWYDERNYEEASAVASALVQGYGGTQWGTLGLGIMVNSLYKQDRDDDILRQRDWIAERAEGEAGVEILVLLAEVEARSGDAARSLAWLRQAQSQADGMLRTSVTLKLAQQEYNNGHYAEALTQAAAAEGLPAALDEERRYLMVLAGFHLAQEARTLELIDAYLDAYGTGAHHLEVSYLNGLLISRQGDEFAAIRIYKDVLDADGLDPGLRVKVLLALGRSYFAEHKYIQARRSLTEALEFDPTELRGELVATLGAIDLAEKKYEAALTQLTAALEYGVDDVPWINYRLGVAHYELDHFSECKARLQLLAAADLDRLGVTAEVNHMLGAIALKDEDWNDAVELLTRAIAAAPDEAGFIATNRWQLGQALAALGRDDEAVEQWRQVVAAAQDVLAIDAQLAIADNLLARDQYRAARRAFAYVLFNYSNDEYMDDALYGMARCDNATGDVEQMNKNIDELLRDYPDGDKAAAARELQEVPQ